MNGSVLQYGRIRFGRHENCYKEYILIDSDADHFMIQQNEISATTTKETLLSAKTQLPGDMP
jgi:hypothetical protein